MWYVSTQTGNSQYNKDVNCHNDGHYYSNMYQNGAQFPAFATVIRIKSSESKVSLYVT